MTSQSGHSSGHDWDDARKAALFADIVSMKVSIEQAATLYGLRVDVIQEWLRVFRRSALLAFDERLKRALIDQGANADALTAAEFTGHVEDISIADLVQTIEIAGKDAVITVTHDGQESRVWCSAGAIIDAESGRLAGEAAVYRILALERGRMVADLRPEPRVRTIYAATHRLLMEALRRKDDGAQLQQKLGVATRYYRLGERSTHARVRVSADELALLRLFDGPRRLKDVIAQSTLGDLESLAALERLVADGYLLETDVPRPAQKSAPSDAEPPSDSSVDSKRTQRVEPPQSAPSSFVPLAMSRGPVRPARGPRRAYALLAGVALAPAAFWLGQALFNLRAQERAATTGPAPASSAATPRALAASPMAELPPALAEPSAPTPPAPQARAASTFAVTTRVVPESAQIWLDQLPVATGRLDIALPKDGSTHELRVAADGFVPTTLLFADVPPPSEIRLEPLAAAAPSPGSEGPSASLAAAASNGQALERAGAKEPWRQLGREAVSAPRKAPPPRRRDVLDDLPSVDREPAVGRTSSVPDGTPQVQVINGPQVRVIE